LAKGWRIPFANDLFWNDVTWRWEILMEYVSTKKNISKVAKLEQKCQKCSKPPVGKQQSAEEMVPTKGWSHQLLAAGAVGLRE